MAMKKPNGTEFREDVRSGSYLAAAQIRALNEIDNGRALLSVLQTLSVIVSCITAALIWWTPWVIVPAIIIVATRQQACFVLAHDAAHYRLFSNRILNDLIGGFVATIVGISMRTYRVVHRLHHNHLYEARDPDIPLHGGYPRGKSYLFKKLGRDFLGLTAHKTYGYFFGAPAINDNAGTNNRPLDDTSPSLRLAARRDRWLVVTFHLTAPILAFYFGFGLEYLILWVLPLVTVLQAILRLRAICEHGAVKDTQSPLLAARTNVGPKVMIWLLFPHHVNYHIEHHLYPAIPHYNLPDCHAALKKLGVMENAEVRPITTTFAQIFAPRPT